MIEPLLLPVRKAYPRAGIGRDSFYALIREGRIRTVRVGGRHYVPVTEIEAWIARELERPAGGGTS